MQLLNLPSDATSPCSGQDLTDLCGAYLTAVGNLFGSRLAGRIGKSYESIVEGRRLTLIPTDGLVVFELDLFSGEDAPAVVRLLTECWDEVIGDMRRYGVERVINDYRDYRSSLA